MLLRPTPGGNVCVPTARGVVLRQVHRLEATLSSALTDAVRHHRLIHDPARYANIPRPRRGPRVCWSPAQAVAFLRYCAQVHDPLGELYELILCTGLCKGEALALHWADVDLDAQVLLVRYTLSNINNTAPVFTAPKTKSSHTPHHDRRNAGCAWADCSSPVRRRGSGRHLRHPARSRQPGWGRERGDRGPQAGRADRGQQAVPGCGSSRSTRSTYTPVASSPRGVHGFTRIGATDPTHRTDPP